MTSLLSLAVLLVTGCGADLDSRRQALQAALEGGDLQAISEAARAAAAFEGQDPALDRLLGEALANHLLKGAEGLALLRGNPLPGDRRWLEATADAAMRAGDLPVLVETMQQLGLPYDATLPATEQVARLSRQDRAVRHTLLAEVARKCALVDARPQLGRQFLDMPSSPNLERALRLLGATEIVLTRTHLQYSPRTPVERSFQCRTAWLPEGMDSVPSPLPPKGVLLSVTDGVTRGYLEIQSASIGDWIKVVDDAPQAARWLNAAYLLDALGVDPTAEAQVLERFGPGLALPAEQRTAPSPRKEKPLWEE